MVILQIDVNGIGPVSTEGDEPIPGDSDCPSCFALQRMPVEARQVDLLRSGCSVEHPQHTAYPRGIRHAEPDRVAGLEKSPEPAMTETAYHLRKVMLQPTDVKWRFTWAQPGLASAPGDGTAGHLRPNNVCGNLW